VYFEGVLESHLRRIGVVDVTLGAPAASAISTAGLTDDHGVAAVRLPGPAIVRLAFLFRVERLATDDRHPGQGRRWSGAQLEWAWATPRAADQPVELTPDFSRAASHLLKSCQSC
jgi:hypothetical protein